MRHLIFHKQRAWVGQQIRRLGWWIDSFPDENMTLYEKALAVEFIYCDRCSGSQSFELEIRKNDGSGEYPEIVKQEFYTTDTVFIQVPLSRDLAQMVNLPNVKARDNVKVTALLDAALGEVR
jgi:hypothetical protein